MLTPDAQNELEAKHKLSTVALRDKARHDLRQAAIKLAASVDINGEPDSMLDAILCDQAITYALLHLMSQETQTWCPVD